MATGRFVSLNGRFTIKERPISAAEGGLGVSEGSGEDPSFVPSGGADEEGGREPRGFRVDLFDH